MPALNREQRRKRDRERKKSKGAWKPRKLQGHPATVSAIQRGPDDRELEVRDYLRIARKHFDYNRDEEHPVIAFCGALAETASYHVAFRHGLHCDDEHLAAMTNYLTERLGEQIAEFDIIDYRDWRLRQPRGEVAA